MPRYLRAFIAVPMPSSPLLRRVLKELEQTSQSMRVVHPDALHLTLKFLGDITWEEIPDVSAVMERVCAEFDEIGCEIFGTGVFPRPDRPRVVWAGLTPVEPIQQLAYALENELEPLRFPRENKEFKPHVTLGRLKSSRPAPEVVDLLEKYRETLFGEVTIDELELVQSELTREGPRYTTLATADLR